MDTPKDKNKPSPGPVKTFLRYTLGPVTMVKQSVGTNTGSYLKDQYHHWKKTSHVDVKAIVDQRHSFDLEEKCRSNKTPERDVRAAYRNVRILMGAFWVGISICLVQLTMKDVALSTAFLSLVAVTAMFVSLAAAAHHQTCIREKQFLSPAEILVYIMANPVTLLPLGLPIGWKLYTSDNSGTARKTRKIIKRKSEKD